MEAKSMESVISVLQRQAIVEQMEEGFWLGYSCNV